MSPVQMLSPKSVKILEVLFAAEIDAAIMEEPLRRFVQRRWGKNQLAELQFLQGMGFVDEASVQVGAGPFKCTVKGWVLLLPGHAYYCSTCKETTP